MTENEPNDQRDGELTSLMRRGLTLPHQRIDALQARISAQIAAESDAEAWSAFTYVMTRLANRWQPVQQWASRPTLLAPHLAYAQALK